MAVKKRHTTRKQERKKRILIVDDHPVMRYGLTRILNSTPNLTVYAEASDEREALAVIKKDRPDLILLDISLGASDGIALCRTITNDDPTIVVLMLSMHDETIYARRALQAGARGYIMKDAAATMLVDGINEVLDGTLYVTDRVRETVLHTYAAVFNSTDTIVDRLSNRERQVFLLMGSGLTTRMIAEKLSVSVKTIDTHRARIKLKLGIKNMPSLVLTAADWVEHEGLTPPRS